MYMYRLLYKHSYKMAYSTNVLSCHCISDFDTQYILQYPIAQQKLDSTIHRSIQEHTSSSKKFSFYFSEAFDLSLRFFKFN